MNAAVLRSQVSVEGLGARARMSAQELRFFLYSIQGIVDLAAIVGGFVVADLLYHGAIYPSVNSLPAVAVVFLYASFGLYGRVFSHDALLSPATGISRSISTLLIALAATLFVAFAMKNAQELSRLIFLAGGGLAMTIVAAERFFLSRLISKRLSRRILSNVLLLDGAIVSTPDDFRLLDTQRMGIKPDIQDPMTLHILANLLSGADRVVVSCSPERRVAWSMALKGSNLRAEIVAPELAELEPIQANNFQGMPTIVVSCGPLDLRNRILKRTFDLLFTVPAVILLTPLLLLAALAIRIESRGSIFFVQTRMGRGNRLFKVYKFRSMYQHLCDRNGVESASRADARLTRVGRILRATSIDELPQLANVILGDMSLVGPRPHALGSLAGERLFWEVDTRYWHRHASKPGLTGLAQIRGFRGATHEQADLTNRLKADLEYLTNWSVWRDLGILLATFRVLRHHNAY
jgi:lipopolysaccharide/colanic/teichoic acid biosynthesis glycosyltransferase